MKALHFRFYKVSELVVKVLTGIVLIAIPLLCLVSVVSDAEIEMQAPWIQGPKYTKLQWVLWSLYEILG